MKCFKKPCREFQQLTRLFLLAKILSDGKKLAYFSWIGGAGTAWTLRNINRFS